MQWNPPLLDWFAARTRFELPGRWVLHAGPPIAAQDLPTPVLNSVAVAIMFEGWADSQAAAEALLLGGDVTLAPAQDYSVVVPLASVLSPSMWAQEVCDRRIGVPRVFSPINGGSGPALRLGLPGSEVLSHLQWLNGDFADWLSGALPESGLPLIPVADHGLAQGDDCHGRTGQRPNDW